MVITSTIQTKNTVLMQEGTYAAVVKAIEPVKKILKDGEKPELKIEFAVAGAAEPMPKRYPATMSGRSPLKREAQAILGRTLSVPEIASFDTDQLLNRNCQVVVVHQHNGGSKPKAVIKTVLSPRRLRTADSAGTSLPGSFTASSSVTASPLTRHPSERSAHESSSRVQGGLCP